MRYKRLFLARADQPGVRDHAAEQKQMKPDVWVSSHAGHFNLHTKYKPGDAYDSNRFVDPAGYVQKIEGYEKLYREQLDKDRKAN
jgi:hypothetical protein